MNRTHTLLRDKQTGFTLVEALITFLILAIGLLGLAGLQTKGLSFDKAAYQRTQAALLASDIADRMRANRITAQTNGYDLSPGPYSSSSDCVATNCSPAQLSQFDRNQWKTALAQLLPAGDGDIVTAGTTVTITVYWDELRTGKIGKTCINSKPASDNDLTCFQLQTL